MMVLVLHLVSFRFESWCVYSVVRWELKGRLTLLWPWAPSFGRTLGG